MVVDPETERQEARKAKRQLLLLIVGAAVVGVLGLYGIGMLSDAAIRAGLQPKSWTRAEEEKRKAGPVEEVQAREEPEAVAAAPDVPITPAPQGPSGCHRRTSCSTWRASGSTSTTW